MTDTNPYQAPASDVRSPSGDSEERRVQNARLAGGQKLLIYSVLLYFVAVFLQASLGLVALLMVIACLIMSLIGMYRVLAVLDNHVVIKVVLFILLFIPLVNILVLLRMNARATQRLREAGYKVGLLGARKQ